MTRTSRSLDRWARRFTAGKFHNVGLWFLGPDWLPGERLASKVALVGVSEQQAAAPMAAWVPRPGSMRAAGMKGRSEGLAYATSERVLVANASKVSHEWRWDELFDVRVLPNYDGVVLAREPDPEVVEVIAGEQNPFVPQQSPHRRALQWIRFEGAFAASRGRLDEWLQAVPQRFDGVAQG